MISSTETMSLQKVSVYQASLDGIELLKSYSS